MTIRNWPESDRPRERLMRSGPATLGDAELLAILLGSGRQGLDAVALARKLLSATGDLARLFAQDAPTIRKQLGSVAACRLLAAREIETRLAESRWRKCPALSDPSQAAVLFGHRLRHQRQEVFACAFLDSRHRLIAFEELFRGGIDGAEVHPREVVRQCLHHNAAALIVGHNHPSGCTEPSAADRHVTLRLKDALSLVDVRLLDHFVIGEGKPVSMAARGWM